MRWPLWKDRGGGNASAPLSPPARTGRLVKPFSIRCFRPVMRRPSFPLKPISFFQGWRRISSGAWATECDGCLVRRILKYVSTHLPWDSVLRGWPRAMSEEIARTCMSSRQTRSTRSCPPGKTHVRADRPDKPHVRAIFADMACGRTHVEAAETQKRGPRGTSPPRPPRVSSCTYSTWTSSFVNCTKALSPTS